MPWVRGRMPNGTYFPSFFFRIRSFLAFFEVSRLCTSSIRFPSIDETLKVWDLANGEMLQSLQGHTAYVMCVAIIPDGKQAISGAADSSLKIWDLGSGKLLGSLEGHSGGVNCVALTPNGKQCISGPYDNTLKLWDLTSREPLQTLKGHTESINCVAIMPDGKHAISGSNDKSIKMWDLTSGKAIATYWFDDIVNSISISQCGNILMVGDKSGRVHKLKILMAENNRKKIRD